MLLPVEIALLADPQWSTGRRSSLSFRVRLTNRGSRPERFLLLDTIRFTIADASGRMLPGGAARDATRRAGMVSDPVVPGRALTVVREARLERSGASSIRLVGEDGFGGQWWIDGLTLGDWRLQAHYENDAAGAPWRGRLSSRPVAVRLVEGPAD